MDKATADKCLSYINLFKESNISIARGIVDWKRMEEEGLSVTTRLNLMLFIINYSPVQDIFIRLSPDKGCFIDVRRPSFTYDWQEHTYYFMNTIYMDDKIQPGGASLNKLTKERLTDILVTYSKNTTGGKL